MRLKEQINPLFVLSDSPERMGHHILHFIENTNSKNFNSTLIDAKNDAEAIEAFLREYKDSPETLRSYTKEIERLLLWCIHESKVNISGLRRNHLVTYQEFLRDPLPKDRWCGPSVSRLKKDGSINSGWKPFVSGLTVTSVKKSIKIIDSFFNYLVQTNYLIGNPLALDRRRNRRNQEKLKIIDRYLELDEIHAVLDALEEYPIQNEQKVFQVIRARYIILLLFYTGLRVSEASKHTMGNFLEREKNWFLRVIGKGNKLREIPIPDELLLALGEFRLAINLPSPVPKFKEKTPLIPMKNLIKTITSRRIDQILKWAFNLGAAKLELTHPRKASKLRSGSAHWLRHSYVTYLLDSGAPIKVVQENAGHSDVSTTMLYRHIAQEDRHAATRNLSLLFSKNANHTEEQVQDKY